MTNNPHESEKVRENRARRAADRQGLRLSKSRRRDPLAPDYNTWSLVDDERVLAARLSLDEAERLIASGQAREEVDR